MKKSILFLGAFFALGGTQSVLADCASCMDEINASGRLEANRCTDCARSCEGTEHAAKIASACSKATAPVEPAASSQPALPAVGTLERKLYDDLMTVQVFGVPMTAEAALWLIKKLKLRDISLSKRIQDLKLAIAYATIVCDVVEKYIAQPQKPVGSATVPLYGDASERNLPPLGTLAREIYDALMGADLKNSVANIPTEERKRVFVLSQMDCIKELSKNPEALLEVHKAMITLHTSMVNVMEKHKAELVIEKHKPDTDGPVITRNIQTNHQN